MCFHSSYHQGVFTYNVIIRYLEGGVDSGFKPIDDGVYVNRLFQVKGRKNIRVEQVVMETILIIICTEHFNLRSNACVVL